MSLELIKFAFSAGELSPTFLGRSDLEKFDLGLALAENFFVDYRGGLTTRPGTVFGDYIKDDDQPVRMFQFQFAPDIANTYILLFGNEYIRFIQDNAYVLEVAKTITAITQANPGVVTAAAHGFAEGDWVKFSGIVGMTQLNGRTAVVHNPTTNTFELQDTFGNNLSTSAFTAYSSAGAVARVYTITSPYTSTDLAQLSAFQYRDLVRLTHVNHAPRDLVRVDSTDWDLDLTEFGSTAPRPTGLTSTPSSAGTSAIAAAVTAVNEVGDESLPSDVDLEVASVDYTTTAGNMKWKWTPVTGAKYYNVYRSLVVGSGASDLTRGAELGYIGRAFGATFVDPNILADFTKTPPVHYNPFAPGTITQIDVLAGGAGYTNATTLTVTDAGGGSGFVGFPVVIDGAVVGIVIVNGGQNYVTPVGTLSVGAGASIEIVIGDSEGLWPAISTVFQQRQLYAASINAPLTIWASRPKRFSNFDISRTVADNDSYEFELDAEEVTPIKHMLPVRGGLLTLTNGGVWLLTGGSAGAPVTPTNVLADPHTFTGVSDVFPIKNDTDLLYVESKGFSVRLLEYSELQRSYAGKDISILSNHMFSATQQITAWSFASDPFKLVWARRSDGALLTFTMVKDENVFAWTRAFTKGLFEDVLAVQEDTADNVYVIARRKIGGRWVRYFERFATRRITHVEEFHGVDCGLSLDATFPEAEVEASTGTGDVTFTTDVNTFSGGDVGKVLRMGGGKAVISAYVSPTEVAGVWLRDPTLLLPETTTPTPLPADVGEWTLDAPVSSVSGLSHLEGQTVAVLVDGNVEAQKVVTNGAVTLTNAGTRVVVGIPYTCRAKTLPLSFARETIEQRRKRIVGLGVRLHESRGLKAGYALNKLYKMRERTVEAYGEPTNLQSQMKTMLVMPKWDQDGSLFFVQDSPLPVSILGFVASSEVGDDPD